MSIPTTIALAELAGSAGMYLEHLKNAHGMNLQDEEIQMERISDITDVITDFRLILIPAAMKDKEMTEEFQRRLVANGYYLIRSGFFDWEP